MPPAPPQRSSASVSTSTSSSSSSSSSPLPSPLSSADPPVGRIASRPFRLDFEPNPFEVSFQSPSASANHPTKPSASPPNRASQPRGGGAGAGGAAQPEAFAKRSNTSASPAQDNSSNTSERSDAPNSDQARGGSAGAADSVSGPTGEPHSNPHKQPSSSDQDQDKQPETPVRGGGHGGNSGSVSSNGSGTGAGSNSGNASAPNSTSSKSLPGITTLTSPSDGNNPFNWVTSSLRDGPLSPAMLGAPSTSNQGFDVSAFRTGLTPDLSNFKTGLTPLGPGMSLPPTSPNTAAFLSMVSSNGAANPHSGSVNAQGMLSISAPPNYGGTAATLTPNTLTALTNAANAANNTNDNQHNNSGSADYFSHRSSNAGLDRPGSRLRNSMTMAGESNDSGQPTSVSPDVMESKQPTSRPESHRFAAAAQDPFSASGDGGRGGKGGNSVDHSAASGLYLLSQAHHELSKREGNVAAAQAAAQALKGIPRPTESPAQAQGNPRGNKRKKSSPQATSHPSATDTNEGNDDASSRPGGKGRGKGRPAGSKKARTDSNTSSKRNGKKSSPSAADEDEGSDESSNMPGTGGGTEEDKRKSFLERNRQAALKCRQRKKAWLQSLQQTVEVLRRENESLTSTVDVLQQEVVYLRAQLLQGNGPPNAPGPPPSAQQPPNASNQPHPNQSPTAHQYLPHHPQLGRDLFPPHRAGLPAPSHAGPGYPYGGMPPPPPPGGFGQALTGVDGKKIDVQ